MKPIYGGGLSASGDPRAAGNWVMGDLAAALKESGREIGDSPVSAERLGELIALIGKGELTGKLAKEVFGKMMTGGGSAREVMERDIVKIC